MSKYHLTQSLLASWMYQFEAAEDYTEQARESFLLVLNRETTETTFEMERGIAFEDAVKDYLDGVEDAPLHYANEYTSSRAARDNEIACVKKVAKYMKGATYQVVAYKDIEVKGMTFSLMAKCDWVREGVIYDCKRVNSYDVGKYLEKPQHPVYLEVLDGAKKFTYVIADGEDVYTETYTRETLFQPVETIIAEFVEYLESQPELLEIYKEKWKI